MSKNTVRLATPRFGEIAYSRDDVYTFPNGLVGLRDLRHFVMLDIDEAGIFHCLQCVDNPAFAFVLVDPLLLRPDYKVKVDEGTIALLELDDLGDAVAFATVVVPENTAEMTANLRGPVIINTKTRIGTQIVLPQSEYGVRVSISGTLLEAEQDQEEELHA
ncbi:MAG: flagellar assembly protein FliW [bacterium]